MSLTFVQKLLSESVRNIYGCIKNVAKICDIRSWIDTKGRDYIIDKTSNDIDLVDENNYTLVRGTLI
jgi:hypothetical protein